MILKEEITHHAVGDSHRGGARPMLHGSRDNTSDRRMATPTRDNSDHNVSRNNSNILLITPDRRSGAGQARKSVMITTHGATFLNGGGTIGGSAFAGNSEMS